MAKFSKIIQESNQNLLIKNFIKVFKQIINKKTKGSNRLSFVLTGGDSPKKLYKKLVNAKNIPWTKIDFFISDERYVKENSINSNIKMCNKYLLKKLKISKKQIFKIPINNNSVSLSAKNYEKSIKKYFYKKEVAFDIMLLGIGDDGHIASLFKENINNKLIKNVDYVKKKDFFRITLTSHCINKSKYIFLWAPGKKKINIVKKICADNKKKYPASFLKKKNNFLFYCN
jgi:6-phosphogluconolactonase